MNVSGNFLRLVIPTSEDRETSQATTASTSLVLRAIRAQPMSVRKGAMSALLSTLQASEHLEFVHQLVRGESGSPQYRLTVDATSTESRLGDLTSNIRQGLSMLSDMWAFEVGDSNNPPDLCTNVWRITPSPLQVAPLPGLLENEVVFRPGSENHFALPFPSSFPDWTLSSLLNEDLGLPEFTQVIFRIYPRQLSRSECVSLQHLRHRIQSHELVIFHPRSSIANFSVARELMEPLLALTGQWLREPKGYGVDLIVKATGYLPPLSVQRIAMDSFGDFPVSIRSVSLQSLETQVPRDLHLCLHHSQRLPVIWPDARLLPGLGVPRLFNPPLKLSARGIPMGTAGQGNQSVVVRLPDSEVTSHLSCIGASGSGKSTFLEVLLEQKMAAGDGVALFDSHGPLYRNTLKLIPKSRMKDVICVDVEATDRIVCINPLSDTKDNPQKANFVANEIVNLIDVLFESTDSSGPAARSHAKELIKLATWFPKRDGTFLDVLRLLEDTDFMDYLLSKCADRPLCDSIKKWKITSGSDTGFASWVSHMIPKFSPFAASPKMRTHLSYPRSTVNLGEAVRDGKIVLFNLSQATLGSTEARIFGNLMLNQLFYGAMQRGPVQGTEKKTFHLVIDEAASICTESMLPMWAQARKFGLSITTASQSLNSLRNRFGSSSIAEAMLANTATKVLFRLGAFETERLSPYFNCALSGSEMVELPTLHALVNMVADGHPVSPFVMQVHRTQHVPLLHAEGADVVAMSQAEHGWPLDAIVASMSKTFELNEVDLAPFGFAEKAARPAEAEQSKTSVEPATPKKCEKLYEALVTALHQRPGLVYPDDLAPLLDGKIISKTSDALPTLDDLLVSVTKTELLSDRARGHFVEAIKSIQQEFWPEIGVADCG